MVLGQTIGNMVAEGISSSGNPKIDNVGMSDDEIETAINSHMPSINEDGSVSCGAAAFDAAEYSVRNA